MPENLLSYQGNAGLGIGSSPDVAVPANVNRKVVNDALRDIMLLNNERNLIRFQQKISDRDQITEMIMMNQVPSGDVEPGYLKYYNEAKDKATKAFDQWGGDLNDHQGYQKYQEAVTELRDVATHAKSNTIQLQKLRQEEAAEQLPSKKKRIADHISKMENQDFWEQVQPYQQLHDLNPATFSGFVEPIKSTEPDPNNPARSFETSKIDYDSILRNSRNAYIYDLDKANDIEQLYKNFSQYDQPQLKKSIAAMNAQIDKYNKQYNFVPGQPGFVTPVNTATVNDKGDIAIKEYPADFAAKFALANNEDFVTRTAKVDYKLLAAQNAAERNKIAARKVGIEASKADAYIKNLKAKTEKYLRDNKTEATNIEQEYNDFVDNIKPRGIIETDRATKKTTGEYDAIFLDKLPEGYRFINGPIVGMKTTVTGKGSDQKITQTPTGKIEVGKLEPFVSSDGREYYLPKYKDPVTGDDVDLRSDKMKQSYLESRMDKDIGKFTGSFDDYLRALLKKGKIEMVVQGKNGTANYTSMFQSAKLLNAQGSKKGGENIINPPDEGSGDETDEPPQTDQ